MEPVELLQQKVLLRGIVEGVGMRPALFRLARKLRLAGWVRNRSREVEVLWQGGAADLARARRELVGALPPGSRIDILEFGPPEAVTAREYCGEFSIREEAGAAGSVNLLTPPDRALCAACRTELYECNDRHFHHAFNGCAACGPRATVIDSLPYERQATAWRDFPLCPACRYEYENPADRRFHIEGISCPECGPVLELLAPDGAPVASAEAALEAAASALRAGKILALKGVGGFQLLADPRCREALTALRKRKHRPDKPLALMAADPETVSRYFTLSPALREALEDPAAPIVLAPWRAGGDFHPELLAPDRPEEAGVMLPASPLHELLMRSFGGPLLVATSGNAAGAPPALTTEAALRELAGIADLFLTHNRAIRWRHDDSLAVENGGVSQLWRRARGCGWALEHVSGGDVRRPVLALGGAQKNTFAAAGRGWLLLSPHHGELEAEAAAAEWEEALRRTVSQLAETPECIAVDAHPDYYSSLFGRKLAQEWALPLVAVPHHAAHALAGLYESGFPEALALVFDGSGWGMDGTLWGAELFRIGRESGIRRLASFAPVPLPGGAAAIRDCRRQWLGRLWAAGVPEFEAARQCTLPVPVVETLYRQCAAGVNAPLSSAAGRLFDAFAARLGLAPERVSYEGQAAIRLEAAAWREPAGSVRPFPWEKRIENGLLRIDWTPLWHEPLTRHVSPARDFHGAVTDAALAMLEHAGEALPVLLTGGVMQNRLLTALLAEELRKRGRCCWLPRRIPPNDGGIAVGQIFWDGWNFEETK